MSRLIIISILCLLNFTCISFSENEVSNHFLKKKWEIIDRISNWDEKHCLSYEYLPTKHPALIFNDKEFLCELLDLPFEEFKANIKECYSGVLKKKTGNPVKRYLFPVLEYETILLGNDYVNMFRIAIPFHKQAIDIKDFNYVHLMDQFCFNPKKQNAKYLTGWVIDKNFIEPSHKFFGYHLLLTEKEVDKLRTFYLELLYASLRSNVSGEEFIHSFKRLHDRNDHISNINMILPKFIQNLTCSSPFLNMDNALWNNYSNIKRQYLIEELEKKVATCNIIKRNAVDWIYLKKEKKQLSYPMNYEMLSCTIPPQYTNRGNKWDKAKLSKAVKNWLAFSQSVAVVIGINEYENEYNLTYAVNDAETVKKYLEKYTSYRIYDELYDKNATKRNILDLIDRLNNDNSLERIIIYFAGHGRTEEAGAGDKYMGYILPSDSNPKKLISTAISMSEIKTWSESFKARHVLFIFDACFSGIIGGSSRENGRDYYLDFLVNKRGRHVITAGTKDQKSQEYSQLEHGALTYFFLKGLKGEADLKPEDGIITLTELESYIMPRVANYTKGKQNPQLIEMLDGGQGEILIELSNN